MSLQNMHRHNKIKNQADRKILPAEFFTLVNNAFAFLKVQMPQAQAEEVFKQTDKDGDGLITYVEYFQFIDKYICQTRECTKLFI